MQHMYAPVVAYEHQPHLLGFPVTWQAPDKDFILLALIGSRCEILACCMAATTLCWGGYWFTHRDHAVEVAAACLASRDTSPCMLP